MSQWSHYVFWNKKVLNNFGKLFNYFINSWDVHLLGETDFHTWLIFICLLELLKFVLCIFGHFPMIILLFHEFWTIYYTIKKSQTVVLFQNKIFEISNYPIVTSQKIIKVEMNTGPTFQKFAYMQFVPEYWAAVSTSVNDSILILSY